MVRAGIIRATKRAGVRAIGCHTLRHTFCSHLAMRGICARVLEDAIHALELPPPWQNRGKDPASANVLQMKKPAPAPAPVPVPAPGCGCRSAAGADMLEDGFTG